ncbi:PadR family transcriptional regulator [Scytonema sp. UIC 10036]|nr:PadR family transcriptional regulator [Scytonema sp. UIC 10036]
MLALYRKELYGLQIIKIIECASCNTRKVGYGSLYPALDNLENKGLVQSRWGDDKPQERHGARRKYYTLTHEGERIFTEINDFHRNLQSQDLPLEVI